MSNPSASKISRRGLLAASGGALATLAGCAGLGSSSNTASPTTSDPSSTLPASTIPLPATPSKHEYATMGHDSAPVSVTYLGNWKCPYCDQFEEQGYWPTLISKYVKTGKIQLTYRALAYGPNGKKPFLGPDAVRAARAGLDIWHTAPQQYWLYHAYLFANQPSEKKRWATTRHLLNDASQVGLSKQTRSHLKSVLQGSTYEQALQQTVHYTDQLKVTGTPTLVINNSTTVNPLNTGKLKNALSAALSKS